MTHMPPPLYSGDAETVLMTITQKKGGKTTTVEGFRTLYTNGESIAKWMNAGRSATNAYTDGSFLSERVYVESAVKAALERAKGEAHQSAEMKYEEEKAKYKEENAKFVQSAQVFALAMSKKDAELATATAENKTLREELRALTARCEEQVAAAVASFMKEQEAAVAASKKEYEAVVAALRQEKEAIDAQLREKAAAYDALAAKMKDALAEKDAEHTQTITKLAAEKDSEKKAEVAAAIKVAAQTVSLIGSRTDLRGEHPK